MEKEGRKNRRRWRHFGAMRSGAFWSLTPRLSPTRSRGLDSFNWFYYRVFKTVQMHIVHFSKNTDTDAARRDVMIYRRALHLLRQ